MSTQQPAEGLHRVIGVSEFSLSIINFTIGAGIFALPAIVGSALGSYSVFAYLICSMMLGAIMLCYAEIGSRVTTTGGSYAYVEAAFGLFPAYVINWLYTFGYCMLSSAALLNVIADSLAILHPIFSNALVRGIFFFLLLGIIVLLNVIGTKQGMQFAKYVTIIKMLPLFAIIIFGCSLIKSSNLSWEQVPTVKAFGDTALILFFAFGGFEASLSVSGELKNPKRTVPLGIFLGGTLILVVYVLLQLVTQGILGAEMETFKSAPLAAVAEKMVGPIGATILLLTAALSCFGNVSADVLATPRLLYAGANDGLFPGYLAKVHPKYATPHMAVITYGVIVFIFSVAGGFKQLAILASAALLLVYLAVILSVVKLRRQSTPAVEKTFKAPGGLIIPLLGVTAIVWMLSSLSKPEVVATVVFIAIVSALYFGKKAWKQKQIG